MAQLLKKILISTSITAGMGLAIGAPASAASITGAKFDASYTASADYLLYCINGAGTQTEDCTNSGGTLQGVLDDGAAGNVELDANSEAAGGWGDAVSFTGQLNGKDITISSLTEDDWTDELGLAWVTDALGALVGQNQAALTAIASNPMLAPGQAAALNSLVNGPGLSFAATSLWTELAADKSPLARLSDPNVSYVTQDGDASGEISIGLIGHANALENPHYSSIFVDGLADLLDVPAAVIGGAGLSFSASELVKIVYNGETHYEYSFKADATGVTEASDDFSHSGEYVVNIDGMEMEPPASTPEPSAMIGMAALVGLYAGKRKLQKNA